MNARTIPSLHAGMGEKVLRHLGRYVDIGQLRDDDKHREMHSIVAGQAVASALSDCFFDGLCTVYNDVDVFRFEHKARAERKSISLGLTHDANSLTVSYGQLCLDKQEAYTLLGTERQGMLNLVDCKPSDLLTRSKDDLRLVLETFDLNCIQVGVRLSDSRLIWTPAFERFVSTRVMTVQNCKTPVHTAVRWFSKKLDLEGVKGHDEAAMALLIACMARNADYHERRLVEHELDHNRHPSEDEQDRERSHLAQMRWFRAKSCFAKEYRAKANRVAASMADWLRIADHQEPDLRIKLSTLVSRDEPDELLYDERIPMDLLPQISLAKHGQLSPRNNRFLMHGVRELLAKPDEDSPVCKHYVTGLRTLVEGEKYADAVRTITMSEVLGEFQERYPRLQPMFVELDAERLMQVFLACDALKEKHGVKFMAVFQSLDYDSQHEIVNAWPVEIAGVIEKIYNSVVDAAKAAVDKLDAPLEPILPLQLYEGTYLVRDLISFDRLAEHSALHHHSGVYQFPQIVEGTRRIISFDASSSADSIILQLAWENQRWTKLYQCKSKNEPVSTAEIKKLDEWLSMANFWQTLPKPRRSRLGKEGFKQLYNALSPYAKVVVNIGPLFEAETLLQKADRAWLTALYALCDVTSATHRSWLHSCILRRWSQASVRMKLAATCRIIGTRHSGRGHTLSQWQINDLLMKKRVDARMDKSDTEFDDLDSDIPF